MTNHQSLFVAIRHMPFAICYAPFIVLTIIVYAIIFSKAREG